VLASRIFIVFFCVCCSYATDLSSAVSYLHYRGLAHLDIKPANILVTRSDLCKLSDFGTSRRIFSVSNGSTSDYEDEGSSSSDSDVDGTSSADEDCSDGAEIEDKPARQDIINLQSDDDHQKQQLWRSRRSEHEGTC
jgi:serine/threonine protein kinase